MSRVFANDLGDRGSISGRVIPKTKKMVLDAALLNTQHYKVWIKGKMEQYIHVYIYKIFQGRSKSFRPHSEFRFVAHLSFEIKSEFIEVVLYEVFECSHNKNTQQ